MTRPPSAGMCSTPRKLIRHSARDSFVRLVARAGVPRGRPHALERGDLQLLPPFGDVALRERVLVPALAARALEARVRARLLLRQRQPRPRVAQRVAAPPLDLDQQDLAREQYSFGHANPPRTMMS